MINLDLKNFEFPFYFDSLDKLKEYHRGRVLAHSNHKLESNTDYDVYEYLNDWEETICTEDPNPDSYYQNVHYKINHDNFRGIKGLDSIDSSTNLCSGCSITFGMGVNEEDSWPVLAYGDSCVNIGLPNASPSRIVRHLSGILDYKTPKSITVLFSTVDRIDSFIEWENRYSELILSPGITRTPHHDIPFEMHKHDVYSNFVLGTNEAYNYLIFFGSLELLIQKAKSKNIELYFSSWNFEVKEVLKKYQSRGYNWFEVPKVFGRARDPFHPDVEYHKGLAKNIKRVVDNPKYFSYI